MRPIIHLFTPIFFVMVGLSLNFSVIDWSSPLIWSFSPTLFVVALLTKSVSGLFISEPFTRRIAIGLAMVPRSEVGLILVAALSSLLPPFVLKAFYWRFPIA